MRSTVDKKDLNLVHFITRMAGTSDTRAIQATQLRHERHKYDMSDTPLH